MQRLNQNYSKSIQQMTGQYLQTQQANKSFSTTNESSFRDILENRAEEAKQSEGLKFSKHANARLEARNINLSSEQMDRLQNGTTKAREKGIQESLVMVDDLAFIVNIKNNTVVTALGDSEGSIFTNIDGAVIN